MTGDTWLDRLELYVARKFPGRRRLRARVEDRRIRRLDGIRRMRDEALGADRKGR